MKKLSRFSIIAAVLAVALAVPVVSNAALQDGGKPDEASYLMKRTPKVGDTAKYRYEIDLTVEGETAKMKMLQTEKILKIEEDGSYEVQEMMSESKFTPPGGEEEDGPDDSEEDATSTVYGPFGTVVKVDDKAEEPDPTSYRRANMFAVVFPDKKLKVGDEWTHEFKADEEKNLVAATAKYKIEAIEKIGERETFKIKCEYKENEGDEPMSSEGTMWMSVKDASLVQHEATFKNLLLGESPPFEGKVVVKRED